MLVLIILKIKLGFRANTFVHRDSNSRGYEKFQEFSRPPEAFFQVPVVSQQCLNTARNSS